MFCPNCRQEIETTASFCPHCGQAVQESVSTANTPGKPEKAQASLQRFQLVIGICSIVFSLFIFFQSFAMGVSNILLESGSASGSIGLLVSLAWLTAGIVSIAGRKHIAPSYVSAGFYLLAAALSQVDIGYFADLQVWGVASLFFGTVCLLSAVFRKNEKPTRATLLARRVPFIVSMVILILTIVLMVTSSSKQTVPSIGDEGQTTTGEMQSDPNRLDDVIVSIESVTLHKQAEYTAIVVGYQFTNKGTTNVSFDTATVTSAFQKGISLERDYYFEGNYPFENSSKQLQTDASIDIYEAYVLQDTGAPISVEVKGFLSFSDAVVKREFLPENFVQGESQLKKTAVQIYGVNLLPADFQGMTVADILDFYGNNYTLDGYLGSTVITYPDLPYKFLYYTESADIDYAASIHSVMVLPGGKINEYWRSGMTEAEIRSAPIADNEILNETFDDFFDESSGYQLKLLDYEFEDYFISFEWHDSTTDQPSNLAMVIFPA